MLGMRSRRNDLPVLAMLVCCISALLVPMSGQTAPPNSGTQQPPKSQNAPVGVRFTDVRKSAGITFVQDSTGTDEKYYLETMGTGVAWLDYDQDGLMDLYFVQAGATDAYKPPSPCARLSITTTATERLLT